MAEETMRNIELKARDPRPEQSLDVCRVLGAHDEGTISQRDTYFVVASGRLKLREQEPGGAVLISYERDDALQQRESRYRIAPVAEPQALALVLEGRLDVRVVVAKRRRLFIWRSVRIHLDEVEELGSFIELEAVAPPSSSLKPEREMVAYLREAFTISDDRLVAVGYADQLEMQHCDLC